MKDDLITSNLIVILDGREVTNFRSDSGVRVLEINSPQNMSGLRCFHPFTPDVTLTKQQLKRLMREMKRILRKSSKSVEG